MFMPSGLRTFGSAAVPLSENEMDVCRILRAMTHVGPCFMRLVRGKSAEVDVVDARGIAGASCCLPELNLVAVTL